MAIASLPWYDLPETRHATDAFWMAVKAAMLEQGIKEVPDVLERELHHHEQWGYPTLMFTQACGYDVAVDHALHLRVVAAPCFDLPGCDGHMYSSYVLVRDQSEYENLPDVSGSRCAVNNQTSHSGTNALRGVIAPLSKDGKFFSDVTISGGHTHSLRLLHENEVDVICVDCITYGLLKRYRPEAVEYTRVITTTPLAPAPPFVTSMRYGRVFTRKLHRALQEVMDCDDHECVKSDLNLTGVDVVDNAEYEQILEIESKAVEYGYFELPAPNKSQLSKLQRRSM
ncbi:MAG: phosphate/phosphite/phosphonate ABC transporter substrate-binding protein [Planctomycetota bacterium]|jgi:ABC-type phosphate/phosphonate transport system substrate-binding protein